MSSKPSVLPDSDIQEFAKLAGEKAHNLFMTGQLLCSEAVVTVVNRALGGGLADDVAIRMAACFPQGVGDSGCLCGAVSGGALALGLFLGRDRPGARDKRKAMDAARDLHNSFKEEFKSTCCRVLSRKVKEDTRAHMRQCSHFTRAATEMVVISILNKRPELLEKANLDYLRKRDSWIGWRIKRFSGMALPGDKPTETSS